MATIALSSSAPAAAQSIAPNEKIFEELVVANPLGERLEHVGIIQVPGEAGGLWIRQDPDTNERQLMVANSYGGIRVLAYNTNLGAQQ